MDNIASCAGGSADPTRIGVQAVTLEWLRGVIGEVMTGACDWSAGAMALAGTVAVGWCVDGVVCSRVVSTPAPVDDAAVLFAAANAIVATVLVATVAIADIDAMILLLLLLLLFFRPLPCTGEVVAVVCESMRPCSGGDTMSSTWPPSLTSAHPLLRALPTVPPSCWYSTD